MQAVQKEVSLLQETSINQSISKVYNPSSYLKCFHHINNFRMSFETLPPIFTEQCFIHELNGTLNAQESRNIKL